MDTPPPEQLSKSTKQHAASAVTPIVIAGEAHLFRGTSPISTFFPVERPVRIYSFDQRGARINYPATEWRFANGALSRTSRSHIPDFARYRYSTRSGCLIGVMACLRALRYPALRAGFDVSLEPRNPPLTINYNIYIDYLAPVAAPIVVARRTGTETARRVLCVGDSITAGAHTVDDLYHHRDNQSWCGLLRRNFGLQAADPAVPGSFVTALKGQLANADVDVAIIAFGMNDQGGGPSGLSSFRTVLDDAVKRLIRRGVKPILVGFFQQNQLWIKERSADTIAYNDAIAQVARANNVPFVDPLRAFRRLAGDYPPADELTADWLHHPNIYGQRIYYSLLAPYFLQHDTPANAINDYVIALGA